MIPKQHADYEPDDYIDVDYLDTDDEDNENRMPQHQQHYDYDYNNIKNHLNRQISDEKPLFVSAQAETSSYHEYDINRGQPPVPKVLTPKSSNLPVSPLFFNNVPVVDEDEIAKVRRRRQIQQIESQHANKPWNMVQPPPPVPQPASMAVENSSRTSSSFNHHNPLKLRHQANSGGSSSHWSHTNTTVVNTETTTDDISEPTIPIDLISTAEETMTSMGEGSVRSSLTDATARDLRYYMRKHMKRQEHLKQQQQSFKNHHHSTSSIINDVEEEASDFVSTSEYNSSEQQQQHQLSPPQSPIQRLESP